MHFSVRLDGEGVRCYGMMGEGAIVIWRVREGSAMRLKPYGQDNCLTQLCILLRMQCGRSQENCTAAITGENIRASYFKFRELTPALDLYSKVLETNMVLFLLPLLLLFLSFSCQNMLWALLKDVMKIKNGFCARMCH